MRKIAVATMAVATIAAIGLAGCSSRGDATGGASNGTSGFDKGATIGVALPDKTSENWVLAGGLFSDQLKSAGYKADVQYAPSTNTVAQQQSQIESMITNGAKVIVIGAKDGSQLTQQVADAKAQGATVIAYDRLILNTSDLGYYVAFDNYKVGELQGQALLDGMKAKFPSATTYNVELFAGSPDDANAEVFFNGAMSVLEPKIKDGTLKVLSGQTDFKQVTTQGWDPATAQTRMDTLLQGFYGSADINGVLSPNDTLARAIIQSAKSAGKTTPIVTGQDSEAASIPLIMSGEQYSTIFKDTRKLVAQTIKMVGELQSGSKVDVNDTKSYNNGKKVVDTYLLPPVLVTKDNAVEAYASDPDLEKLAKAGQ